MIAGMMNRISQYLPKPNPIIRQVAESRALIHGVNLVVLIASSSRVSSVAEIYIRKRLVDNAVQ